MIANNLRPFGIHPKQEPHVVHYRDQDSLHQDLCLDIQASNQQWSSLVEVFLQCSRILKWNTFIAVLLALAIAGGGWFSNPAVFKIHPLLWMGVVGIFAWTLGKLLAPSNAALNSRDKLLHSSIGELLQDGNANQLVTDAQPHFKLGLGLAISLLALFCGFVYLNYSPKGPTEGVLLAGIFAVGNIFMMYYLTLVNSTRSYYDTLVSRLLTRLDNRIDSLSSILLQYFGQFELQSNEAQQITRQVTNKKRLLYAVLCPLTIGVMLTVGYFGATATAHILGLGGYVYIGNPITQASFTLVLLVAEFLLSKACVTWSLRRYAFQLLIQGWSQEQRGRGRGMHVPGSIGFQRSKWVLGLCLGIGTLALTLDFVANCYYFIVLMHGNPFLGGLTALMPTIGLLLPLMFAVKYQYEVELGNALLALKRQGSGHL